MLYGLFRCTLCHREELKRVPCYFEHLPFGGGVSCSCRRIFHSEYGNPVLRCCGDMILDTRYNFHGCLQGDVLFDQGAIGFRFAHWITWMIPRPEWEGWDDLPVPLMV